MGVEVRPTVHLGGKKIACHADDLDTAPVAIRGFDITWGRDDYMAADTSPASTMLTLLDTTGEWAGRIRESTAIGVTVEIKWTGTNTDGTTIGPVTMFRGRVAKAKARPHHSHATDGRLAWLVELTCTDRTADFGNARPGPQPWPQETMIMRANRVRDLGIAGGSAIEQVYFWPGYVDSKCAELDVKGKSALTLMAEMFASMGNDSYAYDPDENVIRQSIRLSQPMTNYIATFDDSQGAVIPVASDITVDGKVYPGIGLGGCELRGTPEITAEPATDINRLECTWKDHSTGEDWTTTKENVYAGDARRVLAWHSWFDDGVVIDPTLDNVWARAREEGRRPRHPEITAKPGFVFISERMARWLLMAWENTRPAFIAGNLAYHWLMADSPDYGPVVAPIGGQTSFDALKGWAMELRVHWIHNQTPPTTSATWAKLQQIKTTTSQPNYPWWYDILGIPKPPPVTVGSPMPERDLVWGPGPGYHWDPSVTWADTRHIPNTGTQIKDVIE